MRFASKVTGSLKTIRLYSMIWLDTLTHEYKEENTNKDYLYPTKRTKDLNTALIQLSNKASKPFDAHPRLLQQLINIEKPERLDDTLYQTIAKLFINLTLTLYCPLCLTQNCSNILFLPSKKW